MLTVLVVPSGGCAPGDAPPPPGPVSAPVVVPPPPAATDTRPAIVFVGTSLTAGYGLPDPALAFPGLIQRRIDSLGLRYRVINAGVSGETSAGALRRIDWVLQQAPIAVLVIETGANDGLRGQPPDTVQANIQTMIDRALLLDSRPRIVIVGMEAMPNLGAVYTTRFRAIFAELAKSNGASLIPFLLDGVAGVDSLNQRDGIHPTARGQELVTEIVWQAVRPLLDSSRQVSDP